MRRRSNVPIFAVHISDGVLSPIFLAVGFAVAGILLIPAVIRINEEEIPRIALLTAAFFVASSIHVKFFGGSVHLLLNGLVGVVLGRRSPLAIVVAIVLQAFLLGHGGYTTIGVNTVVMAVPAMVAWVMFRALTGPTPIKPKRATPAGLVVGASAVVLTAALYASVLIVAGVEDFWLIATAGFAIHLPLAAIEAVIVGFTCGYLARVKPELLRRHETEPRPPTQEMIDYDEITSPRSHKDA
jgi:cobalt/nickel transport system permease protein